ncbi:MAG TPA: MerR family transcriptional regulator [Blastocatellia bacterium]|nr:MerR family transcriptional regulator [Blastocatellia bacterium]
MTGKELADQSAVTIYAVRYYARIGLLRPRRDPRNRYKIYTSLDVRRLRFIRQAKSLGFTLREIVRIFEHAQRKESPCPTVRRIIERRIKGNRELLNELNGLQNRMERAMVQWKRMPDRVPNGQSVCHLIESTGEPSLT